MPGPRIEVMDKATQKRDMWEDEGLEMDAASEKRWGREKRVARDGGVGQNAAGWPAYMCSADGTDTPIAMGLTCVVTYCCY